MRIEFDGLDPKNRSYRPPSWPPPRDWVVSESPDGSPFSCWGDSVWNISTWANKAMILDFGDNNSRSRSKSIDPHNSDLLRLAATWRIWGIKSCRSANGLKKNFLAIRRIIAFCSENNIPANNLMSFPRLLEKIPSIIPPSEYVTTILEFHRLWDARHHLGFFIIDPAGLKLLSAQAPTHIGEQTAYIPPRIWAYQVERLKACLDDYLSNKQAIESCYQFCIDAYTQNFGSLEAAFLHQGRCRHPFHTPRKPGKGLKTGRRFHGRFELTAKRFGIDKLIERWVTIPIDGMEVGTFSGYLTLVQHVGLAYIANFTLQRATEAASLRADCLTWEYDERLGSIPLICGETTKTDLDSDARWPTSPSVEFAVETMSSIARLRMRCAAADPISRPKPTDIENPYLLGGATEPWCGHVKKPYSIRLHPPQYQEVQKRSGKLFDPDKLRITEEDLRIARMLTPNLSELRGFAVGSAWPLTWHQLRRTGAVNMFSSGLISDSSLQFLMKHSSRVMPLYYGRGYTKLSLNEDVESLLVKVMYESMANKLQQAAGDRFVSPLGKEHKQISLINLISDKDSSSLANAARRGEIFYREMRVGACTRRGPCPYGGIESISRCTGGDGRGPCTDALYDRDKAAAIEEEILLIDQELAKTDVNSPRFQALQAERKGMENFLDVVRK